MSTYNPTSIHLPNYVGLTQSEFVRRLGADLRSWLLDNSKDEACYDAYDWVYDHLSSYNKAKFEAGYFKIETNQGSSTNAPVLKFENGESLSLSPLFAGLTKYSVVVSTGVTTKTRYYFGAYHVPNAAPVVRRISFSNSGLSFKATDEASSLLKYSGDFEDIAENDFGIVNNGTKTTLAPEIQISSLAKQGVLAVIDNHCATDTGANGAHYRAKSSDVAYIGWGSDSVDTLENHVSTLRAGLWGFGGDDFLIGNALGDYLNGGLGADNLTGNAGADRFAYGSKNDGSTALSTGTFTGFDTITDFRGSTGDDQEGDKIRIEFDNAGLRVIDADVTGFSVASSVISKINTLADFTGVSLANFLVFAINDTNDGGKTNSAFYVAEVVDTEAGAGVVKGVATARMLGYVDDRFLAVADFQGV